MTRDVVSIPWAEYSAYREVTAHPKVLNEERFTLDSLLEAARKSEVLFRGWPFIFFDERFTRPRGNRVETVVDVSDIRGHDYFETWQLWQSGLFFHRALMDEASYAEATARGKVIDFVTTLYHVSEAIGSLWRLYAALGAADSEVISIEFRYTDTAGRRVTTLDAKRAPIRTAHPCADDEVIRRREAPLATWRTSDAEIAAQVAADVLLRFGWTEPNRAAISKITREFLAKPRF